MARKKQSAKVWAEDFRGIFFDQYENEPDFTEEKVKAMTEEQAAKFVQDHIENMIAINGAGELWMIERQAAKDLNIKIDY